MQSDQPTVLSENIQVEDLDFAPRAVQGCEVARKTLISSDHCRAMTNVPLLICDKWWKAVDLSFKTRWTLSVMLPKNMLL